MSDQLWTFIRHRQWDEVMELLRRDPLYLLRHKSKLTRVEDDKTCLHWACMHRAPLEILQLILSIDPSLRHSKDSLGWNPLHFQIIHGNDVESTLFLIDKKTAQAEGPSIGTALALAARHGCCIVMLRALLQANTAALWHQPSPAILLYHTAMRRQDQDYLLKALEMFVRELYHKFGLTEVLHFVVTVCRGQADYAHIFLEKYPQSIYKDPSAIFMACSSPYTCYLVSKILDMDESLARMKCGNQLPLHCALEHGRSWRECVQTLVESYPESLTLRDPISRLYPFLQASFDITTAYHLLQSNPTVLNLRGCMSN